MNQMKRDVILKPNRKFYPEKNYSHQELVLHATLLSRIFFNNNYSRKRSKQKDLKLFNLASNEELKEYIIHFFEDSFDPEEKDTKMPRIGNPYPVPDMIFLIPGMNILPAQPVTTVRVILGMLLE